MNVTVDETLSTLRELARICRDAKEGYLLAADREKTSEFSALFLQLAQERSQMRSEILAKMHELGESHEENGGGATGFLFRGWVHLRTAMSGGNSEVILEECERGEEAAAQSYQKALQSGLTLNVHVLIQKHHQKIVDACSKIRLLRLDMRQNPERKITFNLGRADQIDDLARTTEGGPD